MRLKATAIAPAVVATALLGGTLLVVYGGALLAAAEPYNAAMFAPFDTTIQAEAAARALESGDTAAALKHTHAALSMMPLNQRALTLLSLADPARRDAMNVSAALGWRDPVTNNLIATLAIRQNEPQVAAARVDAIGRIDGPVAAAPLLDALLALPGGCNAFAKRAGYRMGLGWIPAYLALPDTDTTVLRRRTHLAQRIAVQDVSWNRQVVESMIIGLGKSNQGVAAQRFWRATLADPKVWNGFVYDGRFASLDMSRPALGGEWAVVPETSAFLEKTDRGLRISATANMTGPVLHQALLLPPGPVRLRVVQGAAPGSERLAWSLTCYYGGLLTLSAANRQNGNGKVERMFETRVPVGCGVADLTLSLISGTAAEITLQSVSATTK